MVIAFGAAYCFPGFCRNQNIQNRLGCIEELFCWCQVLRQQLILLSFCINVLSCSFHVAFISCHFPFICMHLPFILHSFPFIFLSFVFIFSFSFQIPFVFIPMCIHGLSSSFHFAFISFHFVSKAMEMALWLGQGTECSKWLSLGYR